MTVKRITRRSLLGLDLNKSNKKINLNPEWPTPKVASIYKKYLQDQLPVYLPNPTSDNPPSIQIIPTIRSLPTVDWNDVTATHLLKRILPAPRYDEIQTISQQSLDDTLTQILENQPLPDPPGAWATEAPPEWDTLSEDDILALIETYNERMFSLMDWWIIRMTQTPVSITESMTLFWHDHFATSHSKVFYPQAMFEQNQVIREHGLGNFKTLLRKITFGPAMMIWLDTHGSKKWHPNENFGRELLELFTLGVDNYTQEDIEEASRAFTGYVTNGLLTNYDYNTQVGWGVWWEDWHDFDEKIFLGQTGNWTGDDIINIILEQEETAQFLCQKIYQWFVYESADEVIVNEMATIMRNNDYEIKPVLEFLFSSEHFYNVALRGAKIRNPLSVIQGTVRQFDLADATYPDLFFIQTHHFLGMLPLQPPDVSGWPGYRTWINSISLPIRKLLTTSFIDGNSPLGQLNDSIDMIAFAISMYNPDENQFASVQMVQKCSLLLFGVPLSEAMEADLLSVLLDGAEPYDWYIDAPENNGQWDRFRDMLRFMMKKPEFQLS